MKYFTYDEFDSPDLPGSGHRMNSVTLDMLDRARGYAGVPFIINSGYRTLQHELAIGGFPNSAHTRGYAADIRVNQDNYGKILASLIRVGFSRIGLASGFIHADNDPDKPSPAVWTYGNSEHLQKLKNITLRLIKERNSGRSVDYGLLTGTVNYGLLTGLGLAIFMIYLLRR